MITLQRSFEVQLILSTYLQDRSPTRTVRYNNPVSQGKLRLVDVYKILIEPSVHFGMAFFVPGILGTSVRARGRPMINSWMFQRP